MLRTYDETDSGAHDLHLGDVVFGLFLAFCGHSVVPPCIVEYAADMLQKCGLFLNEGVVELSLKILHRIFRLRRIVKFNSSLAILRLDLLHFFVLAQLFLHFPLNIEHARFKYRILTRSHCFEYSRLKFN